ncbi:hypothetical protein [Cohnella cellulosilytica]|uniref:hypothetical protein n=1 Tax=Cohnella cellulosilytica TaxID=986710 RepID=UPI0036145505
MEVWGMAQIQFPFEIDREATRAAVEERLESARIYKQVGFFRREMKTTPAWEPREHGATNVVGKPRRRSPFRTSMPRSACGFNMNRSSELSSDWDEWSVA